MFLVGTASAVGAFACVVPAMSASGALVTEIAIEEHYALSNDLLEVSFRGKALERVVNLFDKHHLFGLRGTYHATGVVDTSRVVLFVRDGKDEKKVVIQNCREPRFCAFVAEALEQGELKKPFAICRSENVCARDDGE